MTVIDLASTTNGGAAMDGKTHSVEVWGQLLLANSDADRLHEFLQREIRVSRRSIITRLHVTVYHARRPMPGLQTVTEPIHVVVPAEDTRFMVMAPGGENPRPELVPSERKVGIRIRRTSEAFEAILSLRRRLIEFETPAVLGTRRASDHRRNAFGARQFQAHMSLLRPGSGIDRDLTMIGKRFRDQIDHLVFDRFMIDVSSRRPPSIRR
jgi:hypothetical protein